MFFRNKQQEAFFQKVEERLQSMEEAICANTSQLDALSQLPHPDLGPLGQNLQKLDLDSLSTNLQKLDLDSLSTNLQKLDLDSLGKTAGQLAALNKAVTELDGRLGQNINQLHTAVQKHDMAIEDLLDEWEEKKSDEQGIQDRFREHAHTEKLLLDLFEAYQEQFWNLKRFAEATGGKWSKQVALMEQNLQRSLQQCGIRIIQERGAKVDYALHEIVEAVETTDPALDKKISDIYRCGYIYKGKVKKKAQAAAYRMVPKTGKE